MGQQPQALILMGVSGCGKSSVGELLSQKLGWPFFDGDDFHPPENVAKMAAGNPLNDDDRTPWLANLHDLIADHLSQGKSILLACSALKQKYRDQLAAGNPGTVFVHLKGDFDLIFGRMQARAGHYMKARNCLPGQLLRLGRRPRSNRKICSAAYLFHRCLHSVHPENNEFHLYFLPIQQILHLPGRPLHTASTRYIFPDRFRNDEENGVL